MRVAFIGPVGAGKSTQAQRLSWTMPFYNRTPRLSTGDLVRAQIEAQTTLGREIRARHDAGEPVSDGAVLDLLQPHVRTAGGFALDDFPASVAQAEALDAELEERSAGPLHHVISLEGPTEDELVERVLGGRVHSRTTDVPYHIKNDPPRSPARGSTRGRSCGAGATQRRRSGGASAGTAGSTSHSRSATRSGAS